MISALEDVVADEGDVRPARIRRVFCVGAFLLGGRNEITPSRSVNASCARDSRYGELVGPWRV